MLALLEAPSSAVVAAIQPLEESPARAAAAHASADVPQPVVPQLSDVSVPQPVSRQPSVPQPIVLHPSVPQPSTVPKKARPKPSGPVPRKDGALCSWDAVEGCWRAPDSSVHLVKQRAERNAPRKRKVPLSMRALQAAMKAAEPEAEAMEKRMPHLLVVRDGQMLYDGRAVMGLGPDGESYFAARPEWKAYYPDDTCELVYYTNSKGESVWCAPRLSQTQSQWSRFLGIFTVDSPYGTKLLVMS